MMDVDSFVEGPLLKIVFLVFCIGILYRTAVFVSSIIKGSQFVDGKPLYLLTNFAKVFAPYYRAVPKKPLYASLRYLFHICLFVVPIWLVGHITLWEESFLEWSWISLPNAWADWMTLLVVAIAALLIIRHMAFKDIRTNTSISDYFIIIIAALPFITGYFLAHGTLDNIPFFANNIWTIHILSGEVMIITAVFLFCKTRLDTSKCTGCASCVESCPTGTLEADDVGNMRIFSYSHYQCICCASCVNTCPESAADIKHEISLKRFLEGLTKKEIRSVELESCHRCGALFVPEPLMEKIHKQRTEEYLKFCPNCRRVNMGDYLLRLSPVHLKSKYLNFAQGGRR